MIYTYGVLSFLIFASILAISCKTTKVAPEQYEQPKIYFGNGGGFTGRLNEFCMLDNGEVYQINPSSREATIKNTCSKSDTKNMFKVLENLELKKYPYDKPGNMFFWMKYHSSIDSAYLIWGDENMHVDEKIIKVYDQLVDLTREQNKY